MNNLEKFIANNKEQFDLGTLPHGHQERFKAKLQTTVRNDSQKNKGRKKFTIQHRTVAAISFSIAAIFILTLLLGDFSGQKGDTNISVIIPNAYAQEMKYEETEVMKLIKNFDAQVGEQVMNTLDNITFEAIPLSEQLPPELSEEQRAKILKEYYKQKTDGIKKVKIFLAQEVLNHEE